MPHSCSPCILSRVSQQDSRASAHAAVSVAGLQRKPQLVLAAFQQVLRAKAEALGAAGRAQIVQRCPFAFYPNLQDAEAADGCYRPIST